MPTWNGEENVLAYLCNKLLPNYISLDLKENEVFSCKHIMLKEEGCQIKKESNKKEGMSKLTSSTPQRGRIT